MRLTSERAKPKFSYPANGDEPDRGEEVDMEMCE